MRIRPSRENTDMIFTERQIQKKYREQHRPFYMTFIDLSKMETTKFEELKRDEYVTVTEIPPLAWKSILSPSKPMPDDSVVIRGYDFNKGLDYHALLQTFLTTGCQATNFGLAAIEINKMLAEKMKPLTKEQRDEPCHDPTGRPRSACTIFLGFTSNMISTGVRESIKYLVQHNMVDVVVTTAGAIEEDIMKCFGDTYAGDFKLDGTLLHTKGHNRIGNMILPNNNYIRFHDWVEPVLDEMHKEQEEQGVRWIPSTVIRRFGKEINHEDSVLYWAYKNNISIFCPALTDGSIGDMLYMHSYRHRLIVDIVEDVRRINNYAIHSIKSGIIILGGGVAKHHICNANCMRAGADFAVFVNTATHSDSSDSGAPPEEAVSWGKIKSSTTAVKVHGDATIIFPLLVAETFYRHNDKKADDVKERCVNGESVQ